LSEDTTFGEKPKTPEWSYNKSTNTILEKREPHPKKNINTLLWNIEGMKTTLPYIPEEIMENTDAMILTETFLTDPIELQGYYAIHTLATPTEEDQQEELLVS
ncbi:hypothetical protein ANN_26400, partial [Periplaneta americana]